MKSAMENVSAILLPGETVLMATRQSYLASVSPSSIFVTDKRLIVVHNSFWGLYTGYNILSRTRVSMMNYSSTMGVILTEGTIMSSLRVAFPGAAAPTKNTPNEWGIDGLRHHDAKILLNYIQDLNSNIDKQKQKINAIDLDEAKRLVEAKKTKFIWLGVQNIRKVVSILRVDPSMIIKLTPSELGDLSKTDLEHLNNCVLVDFNSNVSMSTARYLKRDFEVNMNVLKGGLAAVKGSGSASLLSAIKKDIKMADTWTVRHTQSIARLMEIAFGLTWGIDAASKFNPSYASMFSQSVLAAAHGQPQWLAGWFSFWAMVTTSNPAFYASLLAVLEVMLAISLIFGLLRKIGYGGGAILSLIIWSVPQGLGGLYGPSFTDIGTGLICVFVFVFLALINATYGRNKYTVDYLIEKHVKVWEAISEVKHSSASSLLQY